MRLTDERREYYLELERYFTKKAKEARKLFIEMSIMDDTYCPVCRSRVYVDEYFHRKCMQENGACPVIDVYKVMIGEEKI